MKDVHVDRKRGHSVVALHPVVILTGVLTLACLPLQGFEILQHGSKGADVVDLGVGLWAWPMPMDWDGDGDYDLVVSCPDKPHNGTWYFENPDGPVRFPVFKPGVRVGPGMKNLQVSHVEGNPRVLMASREFVDFAGRGFDRDRSGPVHPVEAIHQAKGNVRFNVWSYVDYDGDGLQDLMVGADDWGYFGWDDGYDADGNWKRGPLHGLVYILPNRGSRANPQYGDAFRIQAGGSDVNVYGNPMPNMADFDGDGDLDLICAEFLDGFTWFENTGTRQRPEFAAGRRLENSGSAIHMHVQMITPTAIDWDRNGTVDIVCGDEDGRVALLVNTGRVQNGMPVFHHPQYFEQHSRDLKFGALATPVSFDWDNDGDEDIISGNTSGNIAFIENVDGGNPPSWAAPVLIEADGSPIHIQAGPNGSIQGPAEAKWGYTTLSVADWDGDARQDLVVNSIWGKVIWFRNEGTRSRPRLTAAIPVRVMWPGAAPKPAWTWWNPAPTELVTQWRTTPAVIDWNGDGLMDIVMLDHEGYLAFFERFRRDDGLWLKPGRRIFRGGRFDSKHRQQGTPEDVLQLNTRSNGGSGRRKFCFADWDGDGLPDLLINSENVHFMKNTGTGADGVTHFKDMGPVHEQALAGHTTSPTIVDWDGNGIPDLLVGAEDGRFYYLEGSAGTAE